MPPPPAPPAPVASSPSVTGGCCCGQSLAFLLLRVGLGIMLILAGVEKFKSPLPPYSYSSANWHDKKNDKGEVVEFGKWLNVAKPVFEFGGFNNTEVYGKQGVNALSHLFRYYALGLPYAMIGVGLFILLGFLNRLSLFLGGGIWLSLAMGQMTLPDNATVQMLMTYTLYYVVALALVKYNRFCITRF
jgi:hypothetical protein